MATQTITTQGRAAASVDEQGGAGRLARFIATAKEWAEVVFSTHGTIHQMESESRAKRTVKETTEFDADMLGL
ncbi:MAG: hypothetical protein FI707_07810 [SAR202 cluster bacterium]|mgnify:FL=1|jgi:hypothetical protein|nr:hypothetical protein [Chloroflexota bacterium]MDP6421712.1 hypothetical protein [SAR202 cluster bacterium]HAL49210.1 hypothetical protein [Dehalococcoidia bacterium]MDP6662917.1 hypothetical protein [SAR202 cluster bacterium]MQG57439.1 hypothetical protein [SAR202 cluster bacterium]|tara:strand:- start:68 stop:286 length:219 start_codon:yes stop_codon:yes gene_type:complete